MAKKSNHRYTPEERTELTRKYHAFRSKGVTAMDAAAKVGVHYITLLAWAKKEREAQCAETPSDLRIVMSNGIAVYGSPRDLAQVLRNIEGGAS
ncbi:MAG: hypothetical protein DRJ03_02120 [Chloroflexi bacterium]|nr:MAG: hypothetical protein DRJ03_02120 [Chloroflexota bacterium]